MEYYLGEPVGFYHKMRRICIDNGVNIGNTYTVYVDGTPCLEIISPFVGWNHEFNKAFIFKDYLCIGLGQDIFFVSIETGEIQEMRISLYFGYFYEYKDRLYIASGDRLYCFDCNCKQIWISDNIAVDGIIITSFEKDTIRVSCEMDPPGGWLNRCLSLADGKEIGESQL